MPMAKELKTNYKVNIKKVLERAKKYPHISKLMHKHLLALQILQQPPLIEQTHEVIQWLDRYSDWCVKLLTELEKILRRFDSQIIKNKSYFLDKFGMAKNKSRFNSTYSEVQLASYFINNGITISEFEPNISDKNKNMDFMIKLGTKDIMIELVTPQESNYHFSHMENLLFEKLERIVTNGLLLEIDGFELFDTSDDSMKKVEPPTSKDIEAILSNFRKRAPNISDKQLPIVFTRLAPNYPRITITIRERVLNRKETFVVSRSSSIGEDIPLTRIGRSILEEKKHLSSKNINFIFVDFSHWSRVEYTYLSNPLYFNQVRNYLLRNKSSKIQGIFSYIVDNQEDEKLVRKRILYLDENNPCLQKPEIQKFISDFENEGDK